MIKTLAEPDNGGPQKSPTAAAPRKILFGDSGRLDLGVGEALALEGSADRTVVVARLLPAILASDPEEAAVELENVLRAGLPVELVNVLRDERERLLRMFGSANVEMSSQVATWVWLAYLRRASYSAMAVCAGLGDLVPMTSRR